MNTSLTNTPDWFEPDGTPVSVSSPISMGVARTQRLLPSVQNILGVIARPALERQRLEQAVLTTLKSPRLNGESIEEFAQRGVAKACNTADGTTQLCRSIERGAAKVAQSNEVEPEDPAAPWSWFFREWLEERCRGVMWTNLVLVHPQLGYAGCAWMLMDHREHGLTLVDLKIQGPRRTTRPASYRGWGYEMSALREALKEAAQQRGPTETVKCVTLILNSTEPHPPVEAPWSSEHLEECWRGFKAARELWAIENSYNPSRRSDAGLAMAA